jgi:hypothetical protein
MVRQDDGTYNPFANPVWQPLIAAQDPKNFDGAADAPLLIIHGGNDEQIPTVSSALLADQLCVKGQELERWMYPGQTHAGVINASANDMIRWISNRFAPAQLDHAIVPIGQTDIDATVCEAGKMVELGDETVPPPTTRPTPTNPTPTRPVTARPATPIQGRSSYTG